MSVENFAQQFNNHDIARAEIEAWRGECLDLFAKGDGLIGTLLALALDKGHEIHLPQLSVQRTMEAIRLVALVGGTDEEIEDAGKALDDWQAIESRGELLAHGTITEVLDREGNWHALIDTVTYRAGKLNRGRWAVGQLETEEFRQQIVGGFNRLKAQLGHVRLRLGS
jgi:hypothetical protein